MEQALDFAATLRTFGIRSGNALNPLKSMLTLLTLELVKRHGSP
jgi:hypothetical protein